MAGLDLTTADAENGVCWNVRRHVCSDEPYESIALLPFRPIAAAKPKGDGNPLCSCCRGSICCLPHCESYADTGVLYVGDVDVAGRVDQVDMGRFCGPLSAAVGVR